MTVVEAENLGPIEKVSFTLDRHGVTVLSAPNGSGKSILLRGVEAAARGKGALPLRDGTTKGHLEVGGAVVRIGARCRHTGAFEIETLEGRFDLASLVDPGLKSSEAADRARIKSLLSLSGLAVSREPFANHQAFDDLDEVFPPGSESAATDVIDLAARVKSAYEAEARKHESVAQKYAADANALQELVAGVPLNREHDQATLQAEYDAAQERLTTLRRQAQVHADHVERQREAAERLRELEAMSGTSVEEAERSHREAVDRVQSLDTRVSDLRRQLMEAEAELRASEAHAQRCEQAVTDAKRSAAAVERARKAVAEAAPPCPTDDELAQANTDFVVARESLEAGATVRMALEKKSRIEQYKKLWVDHDRLAESMRCSARSVEDVLSGLIDSPHLRVADGRLLVNGHKRGPNTFYEDLSEGERWRIAIDIAADTVGQDGLFVISQEGWESLDVYVRSEIDEHVRQRKVYALTAEATRDASEGTDMRAAAYSGPATT